MGGSGGYPVWVIYVMNWHLECGFKRGLRCDGWVFFRWEATNWMRWRWGVKVLGGRRGMGL